MGSNREEALRLARLEETVRAARALAHEAGTHLALILGYSELLEDLAPEDAADAAREIATAAKELGALVGRLGRLLGPEAST
jgi:hypothetical protein